MATISRLMTEEEFLALPEDDEVHRELIRGELRERPMTTRNLPHSIVVSNAVLSLGVWLRDHPDQAGCIVSGEARVRLRRDQPTFVGVDVAYVPPESLPPSTRQAQFVDGPPVLVIEVLSPHDQNDDIADKVFEYLDAGVPLVWIANTRFSTVIVHRPDGNPVLFSVGQVIAAEPRLPGLRVAVDDLFRGVVD